MRQRPFERLRIPRAIYEAMVAQARVELPNECCGMLAGRIVGEIGEVSRHFPLVNAAASPSEFLSEPASMFRCQRALREVGLLELAVYHSHPRSAPVPSAKDIAMNYSESVANLIISLQSAEPVARCWWLEVPNYHETDWIVF